MKFVNTFQNEYPSIEPSSRLSLAENKPLEKISILINELKVNEPVVQLHTGKKLALNSKDERYCCILIEGCAAIHRASDDLMLSYVSAPMMVGASAFFYPLEHHYVHAKTDIKYVLLKEPDFFKKVADASLWQHLAHLQAFIIHGFIIRDTLLIGRTTYQIVCNQLRMLIDEPKIIREEISVSRYILERTQLSRSNVMNILSQLRSGNYISMEKGLLLAINHLPNKF